MITFYKKFIIVMQERDEGKMDAVPGIESRINRTNLTDI